MAGLGLLSLCGAAVRESRFSAVGETETCPIVGLSELPGTRSEKGGRERERESRGEGRHALDYNQSARETEEEGYCSAGVVSLYNF